MRLGAPLGSNVRHRRPTISRYAIRFMNLDIGAKKTIDADQVFLVARCSSPAEPPFALLYDPGKKRRKRRNIRKIAPDRIIAALGADLFAEIEYPGWGVVWFRVSRVRAIRELAENELVTSQSKFGSLVLFEHDPEPEDEHAGFLLFGMDARQVSRLLGAAVKEQRQGKGNS